MIKFLGIELEEGTFTIEMHDDFIDVYDLKGNYIYCEYNDGDWVKREFDEQGNEIYFINSNGYWGKCEHNAKGEITYIEDKEGNCVYFGDSYGDTHTREGKDGTNN